jgi:hypothetical protein
MGDRVSLSFKDRDGGESPSLFHHWGGEWFPKYANEWFKNFKSTANALNRKSCDPLTRLEARNILLQFIVECSKEEDLRYTLKIETDENFNLIKREISPNWLTHSIYLGKSPNDGDNSDNGHYTITTHDGKMHNSKGDEIE